ncbi:MAG TPA: sigma-70 family RNA polymerase sigma factor [Actinotalea sp.]|jgi:RNA polymerase sigma-70 factor (ECF subfamily)
MAGWEQLLEEVVRTRRSALVGYAHLFALERADAEDLVQEALVRTFARRRSFPDAIAAEAYVRAAIRTSFLDRARKAKVLAGRSHLLADDDARSADEAAVAGVDVAAALAALSPQQRACTVLRFFDDLPVRDVAAELRLSEGSVKRYLSEGVTTLRRILGDAASWPSEGDGPTVPVMVVRRSVR